MDASLPSSWQKSNSNIPLSCWQFAKCASLSLEGNDWGKSGLRETAGIMGTLWPLAGFSFFLLSPINGRSNFWTYIPRSELLSSNQQDYRDFTQMSTNHSEFFKFQANQLLRLFKIASRFGFSRYNFFMHLDIHYKYIVKIIYLEKTKWPLWTLGAIWLKSELIWTCPKWP
jgi:hypothetical protein